jgi:hypoxanthine phosphoribosyltransferase
VPNDTTRGATVGEPAAGDREILTWEIYGRAIRVLAQAVADDDFEPDIILAIARGGLFAAGSLGYALAVKNIFVMNVEFYTGVGERLDVPMVLPPYIDAIQMKDQRVLIVDDVADTGKTLEMVRAFCAPQVADVRCAVVFEKSISLVKCEYVWRRTDRWINFPWSDEGPVKSGTANTVLDA